MATKQPEEDSLKRRREHEDDPAAGSDEGEQDKAVQQQYSTYGIEEAKAALKNSFTLPPPAPPAHIVQQQQQQSQQPNTASPATGYGQVQAQAAYAYGQTGAQHLTPAAVAQSIVHAYYEQRGTWEQLYDPTTGHLYYRHMTTLQTQWDPPAEWTGKAPKTIRPEEIAEAVPKVQMPDNQMEAKQKEWLKRPARKQATADTKYKLQNRAEGANEFNVWYGKWFGEDYRHGRDQGTLSLTHVSHRLHAHTHSPCSNALPHGDRLRIHQG